MSDTVLIDRSNGVLTLTLNRPKTLNALTINAMSRLANRLENAATDASMQTIIITGARSAFSTGNNITFLQKITTITPNLIKNIVYGTFQRVPHAIHAMDKPMITAINGPAVGASYKIAIAYDFRIASEKARFDEVWISIDCVPALGKMFLLPRIVDLTKTTELILTKGIINTRKALRIELVNKVVIPPDLATAAEELALRLAHGPTNAIAAAKAALNRGLSKTFAKEMAATLDQQLACFRTEDFAATRARPRGAPSPTLHCLR